MILKLFRKNPAHEPVYGTYAAIVAQSRQPRFYAAFGVPDTVTGRFDMISLHLGLLFYRLRTEGAQARGFSQAVFDLFFKDMDRSLREMGVGDLAVPKKIQKMGGAFYGLLQGLGSALDAGDTAALQALLVRNVYQGGDAIGAPLLADYLAAESRRLAALPAGLIVSGQFASTEAVA
jgi:cytochrome b pre-mRNA-processing protein 3